MASEDESAFGTDSENVTSGEEDEGMGSDAEPANSPGGHRSEYEQPYQVLSTQQIVDYMVETIREVNIIVQMPPTTTRILLNHFKWDLEKLYEKYYDGDPDKLFRQAHVVNPFKITPSEEKRMTLRSSIEECEICFSSVPSCEMAALACEHRFCAQCWNQYLTTKIIDEGVVQTIPCAAHGCDILVDDQSVTRLIMDQKVKLKYQHLITNSFVECNRLLCWCPKPECTNAIKVKYAEARSVTCTCGHVFCFACGANWHDPVKCSLLNKWQKRCDEVSGTFNWINSNTKDCPGCQFAIEKNGGCNHMRCKNQNCGQEFCWICLGPWEAHRSAGYSCNRFEAEDSKTNREKQEKSRSELKRYLFYCNRYLNHKQSLELENKLYLSAKEKMDEMQRRNMSWIEVQFLKIAVDVLCQCRQTLMYTYVFAHYLEKNNQSVLFEDNQSDLERATEMLSEYLEKDITSENLLEIKQKVLDKYTYCESRRRVLLDHVHEGYENDLWKYTDEIKFLLK